MAALNALNEAVVDCRRCPRLVEWREQVAREKRAAYRDWDYWGRPDAGLRRSGGAGARSSGSRRRRTAGTAPAGSSPATAPATCCSPSLHRVGMREPGRRRSRATTGWRWTAPTSSPRCGARRRRTSRRRRSATNCAAWLERELALLPRRARGRRASAAFAWDERAAAALPCWAARRCRGREPKFGHAVDRRRRPVAAARLLSPEPAEHVHRQADAGHDGRGLRAGPRAGLGRDEPLSAEILRAPWVGALVASALLARLPIGINALAIVLYLREQTGSFAIAGAVSGSLAAGSGIGAPVAGPAGRPARRAPRAAAARGASRRGPRRDRRPRRARRADRGAAAVRLRRRASRSRRPRPSCARSGRTCSSRACTRRPTRSTRR